VSARDKSIDALAAILKVDRVEAAGVIDLVIMAAAHEAGQRVSESLVEPLQAAVTRHGDGAAQLLHRARRELGGNGG
jgi:hypothetical protein